MELIMVIFRSTKFLDQIVLLLVLVLIALVISHSRKDRNNVQITQELCGAKLFERFIAYAIDSSIIWIIWYICVQWFFLWEGIPYEWFKIEEGTYYKFSPDQVLLFVMEDPSKAACHLGVHMSVMLLMVGAFLYFFLSESGKRESSWGKRMVGLCVVRTDGRKARTLDVLVRTLLKMFPILLSGLTFLPIIWIATGIVWVVYILVLLFHRDHKTIYDMVSDCMVVRNEYIKAFRKQSVENTISAQPVIQLPQQQIMPQQPVVRQTAPIVPQQNQVQQPTTIMPQKTVDMIPPMIPIEHLRDK